MVNRILSKLKTLQLFNKLKEMIKNDEMIVENFENLLNLLEKLDTDGKYALHFKHIRDIFLNREIGRLFLRRIYENMHPNCRRKFFVEYLLKGSLLHNDGYWRYIATYNSEPPYTILISPTMRCNLNCTGCYAKDYTKKDDMELNILNKIIKEGKKIGIYFYTILGGEPFLIWDNLRKVLRKHKDAYFQIFTNGTLLTEEIAMELQKLGNVLIHFSIEGFSDLTRARRGDMVYEKVINSMRILRKYKIPFGYSCCVTRNTVKESLSDEFVDFMIQNGCLVGWYFLYMPVGEEADFDSMPTPEQRLYMKTRRHYLRETRPIFIIDFWNDAPYVGGCICAGKGYIHINHQAYVEPCIFMHLAVDNIKNKSLEEVLNSDFFRALRAAQPYNENLYLPCPIIDNPHVIRNIYSTYQPFPTHPGAEYIATKFQQQLIDYSSRVGEIYSSIWREESTQLLELGKVELTKSTICITKPISPPNIYPNSYL